MHKLSIYAVFRGVLDDINIALEHKFCITGGLKHELSKN